ncbi:MAG: hypothetical protein KAS87_00340 [Candidatus Omnitrophica bacterium]|nr:hypothetical protein [Candidatus Omnitrophota bacterium]
MLISDAPKMYYQILPSELGGGRWVDYKPKNFCTMTKIRWDTTFQSSLIILIIGGLLICTLRTKKE